MGSMPGNQDHRMTGQLHYYRGVKGGMLLQLRQGLLKARVIEVQYHLKSIDTCSLAKDFASINVHKLKRHDDKNTNIQGQRSMHKSQKASENKKCNSEKPDELNREGSGNFSCTVTRPPYTEGDTRTKEQMYIDVKILDNNCNINRSSNN
ncbi:hypothetical protein AYI68_g5956 [Smittium mucronatum]|uniref:Uncharacterized protein n=1 Tax=Smittium mucronatum TaxID=133383 RepID=A0A1R0GSU2_9FUNG|nr:hypothetical protein AYI68_g5956 [Smittium mucronatum]